MNTEQARIKHIFIADDDVDDCIFFEEALLELNIPNELTITNDGVGLMTKLNEIVTEAPPPDVIFLELNMPRKNGYECLEEIRQNPRLKKIPVVVFSTTDNNEAVDKCYNKGANYYVRKPNSHERLKKVIETILMIDLWKQSFKTPRNHFLLVE